MMKQNLMVRALSKLITVAKEIAQGNYSNDIMDLTTAKYPPEIAQLAEAIGMMMVKVEAREYRLEDIFVSTSHALASAIDAKSPWTKGHSDKVLRYSLVAAEALGLDRKYVSDVRIAAILHDIGKIGIPDRILNKSTILTEEEVAVIRRHPLIGADIVGHIKEFGRVVEGIKYHHERYDGKGYPDRLAGEEIPRIARILSVADVFDVITSERPYKKAMPPEEAFEILKEERGRQFDGAIVDCFLKAYPTSGGKP